MPENWRSYAWLTLVALAASSFRWPDIVKTADGKMRWGLLALQLPVAFSISVVAHSLAPAALHFFPYAGNTVSEGLAGVISFLGPLAFVRLFDAGVDGVKKRIGGP